MSEELSAADEAKITAEIGTLTGAAAAVRDIIRLSWQSGTIDSAEVQAIAESYGLLGERDPSEDEVRSGVCDAGNSIVEMTPVFAEIVDNLDAADADAAAAAEGQSAEAEGAPA